MTLTIPIEFRIIIDGFVSVVKLGFGGIHFEGLLLWLVIKMKMRNEETG